MKYGFLAAANAVIAWARRLVSDLNVRDAEIELRLKNIESRLDAGGL